LNSPPRAPNGSVLPSGVRIGAGPPPPPAATSPSEEDFITLAVRLEPIGPSTVIKVPRSARIEEVKDEALRRFALPPATAQQCVIARAGRLIDESRLVGEFGFAELEFLSVGLLDDVYIEDRDWRTGGP
jgi:hypothetical protein